MHNVKCSGVIEKQFPKGNTIIIIIIIIIIINLTWCYFTLQYSMVLYSTVLYASMLYSTFEWFSTKFAIK